MPKFVKLGTAKFVELDVGTAVARADLFDRIMIERLKDGAHDVCDQIRIDMQDLVKNETEHDWRSLISDVADLASILNILSSYGVLDWFPDLPPEMQIQKPPVPKRKPKTKRKRKITTDKIGIEVIPKKKRVKKK